MLSTVGQDPTSVTLDAEILGSGLTILDSSNTLLTQSGLLLKRCYSMSANVTAASHNFYQSLVALSENWDLGRPIPRKNAHVHRLLKEAIRYAWDALRLASKVAIDIRIVIGESHLHSRYFWRQGYLETTMHEIHGMLERTLDDLTHLSEKSTVYRAEVETIKSWVLPIFEAVQTNQKLAIVTAETADTVVLQAIDFIRAMQWLSC